MVLDNINEIDVRDVSPFPTALRYGLIGGLINVGFGIIIYLSDMNTWLTLGLGLLMFVVNIIMIVLAVRTHRDQELGGYITLGRCMVIGITVIVLTALLGMLWNVLLYKFIDPDTPQRIADMSAEMLEAFGLPDEEIEKARDSALESASFEKQIKNSLFGTPIGGAIISLIVGLIMKKSRPIELE